MQTFNHCTYVHCMCYNCKTDTVIIMMHNTFEITGTISELLALRNDKTLQCVIYIQNSKFTVRYLFLSRFMNLKFKKKWLPLVACEIAKYDNLFSVKFTS